MKIRRERYQHGAIRKLKRANGFAWEFRYRVTENGKRKLKSQIFDGAVYRTEKAVRQKIEAQLLRLNDGTEYAAGNRLPSMRSWIAISTKRCRSATPPKGLCFDH